MRLRTQRTVDNYLGRIGIALLRPVTMVLGRLLRRDHQLTVGDEIVWIKLLGGGSLIIAMPMLLGFRRAQPNVKMVLITTPSVRPFAELTGVFDEYRIIDVGSTWRILTSALRVWWQTLHADCIVDLEVHSKLTTVFTTLTMARNRVSFWLEHIFWRRGLASHLVFFNRSSASYHFYDRIGELFGAPIADQAACRAALTMTCGVPSPVLRIPGQICVGFACSDLGQERMLSTEQWAHVARANLRPGHRTLALLGTPSDRGQADAIIARLGAEFPQLTFRNLCGEMTLRESVATIFASDEFWGIDSSLLHFARIAGRRCVSYWGPTDPATRLRDGWQVDEVTHYRKVACSPCVHTSEEPPCRGDNRCIQGLFDPSIAGAPLGWTPVEYPRHRVVSRS